MQKGSEKTTEETSGYVGSQRVRKWSNSIIDTRWWWWWL